MVPDVMTATWLEPAHRKYLFPQHAPNSAPQPPPCSELGVPTSRKPVAALRVSLTQWLPSQQHHFDHAESGFSVLRNKMDRKR